MFLINYPVVLADWLEAHPITAGIISTIGATLISCLFATGLVRFVFKATIEERNKRIVARTSLFPILRRTVKELKEGLENHERLDVSSENANNIFLRLYPNDYLRVNYDGFEYFPKTDNKQEHDYYIEKCTAIKKLLEESNCNVPPKKISKKEWYDNQDVLISFCDYIIHIEDQAYAKVDSNQDVGEQPLHIARCKQLSDALVFFITQISFD